MKLSTLLVHRATLLRQTRLSNLALAHEILRDFASRAARARLTGEVSLTGAAPDAGRYCATLTALGGSQSVIEEHFTDEDIMNLADVIAFITGEAPCELTFRVGELAERFLTPVREELERAGVSIDEGAQTMAESGEV